MPTAPTRSVSPPPVPPSTGNPAWSPDGTKIAFHSNRDGPVEIYVMDADGSDPIRLTNSTTIYANAFATDPAWSPDGTKIAFNSDRDGPGEIYTMDADGSDPTRLTITNPPSAYSSEPTWSPIAKTTRDTSPPMLVASSVTPSTVAAGEKVTVEWRLTSASGVVFSTFFIDALPSTAECPQGSGAQTDDIHDTTYSVTCTILPAASPGLHAVTVHIEDQAGNATQLSLGVLTITDG